MDEIHLSVLFDLALKYEDEDKFEQMCEILDKALRIEPQDDTLLMMKLTSCMKLERFEEAIEVGELLYDLELLTSESKQELGICYSFIGKYQLGIDYINDSVNNGGADFTLDGRTTLVWSYLSLGNYDQALLEAKKCLEILDNSYIRYMLGAVYQKMGNNSEAILMFYEGISKDSDDLYCVARIFELLITDLDSTMSREEIVKFVESIMEMGSYDLDLLSLYKCFCSVIYYECGMYEAYNELSKTIENETHPAAQISHIILKYPYNDFSWVRDWVIDFLIKEQMKGYNFDLVYMAGRLIAQKRLEENNNDSVE